MDFLDPPKSQQQEAIRALKENGLSVKRVLTGDNDAVTKKYVKK